MSRKLKPRLRPFRADLPVAKGAVAVAVTVQAEFTNWSTLDGVVAKVDPRVWLSAPLGWSPNMLALNLALAAAATLGVSRLSAHWLCVRTGMPKKSLSAALVVAARGPGHPVATVEGKDVVLAKFDGQLLRPDLYYQFDVAAVASAPSTTAARALFLSASVAARASRGAHAESFFADESGKRLAVPGCGDPRVALEAVWPWVAAAMKDRHAVILDTDPWNENGTSSGDWRIEARPSDQGRVGFLTGRALARYGIADGELWGHKMSLRHWSAAKSWRKALRAGLDALWREGRILWLAVIASAAGGMESPWDAFPVESLRSSLMAGGVDAAFAAFCAALAADAGGSAKAGARPAWCVPFYDVDRVEGARLQRVHGGQVDFRPVVLRPAPKAEKEQSHARLPGYLSANRVRRPEPGEMLADHADDVVRISRLAAAELEVASAEDWSAARSEVGENVVMQMVAEYVARLVLARDHAAAMLALTDASGEDHNEVHAELAGLVGAAWGRARDYVVWKADLQAQYRRARATA